MADTLTLLGLMLNFAGALLLMLHRSPGLEITADGRNLVPAPEEPAPEVRARNLRRYWKNAIGTRAGLACLCAGFALQILGFVYPDYDTGSGTTTMMMQHKVSLAALEQPAVGTGKVGLPHAMPLGNRAGRYFTGWPE